MEWAGRPPSVPLQIVGSGLVPTWTPPLSQGQTLAGVPRAWAWQGRAGRDRRGLAPPRPRRYLAGWAVPRSGHLPGAKLGSLGQEAGAWGSPQGASSCYHSIGPETVPPRVPKAQQEASLCPATQKCPPGCLLAPHDGLREGSLGVFSGTFQIHLFPRVPAQRPASRGSQAWVSILFALEKLENSPCLL